MINRYKLKVTPRIQPERLKKYPISRNHIIEISDDGQGIAHALAEKFITHHYHAKVCKVISPRSDVVILLEGLSKHHNELEAIKSNYQAFLNAKVITERFKHKGGLFITVQDTGGQFGLTTIPPHKAWTGGLAALTKTAKQEWKKAACRAIDMYCNNQTIDALAERLFAEILYGEAHLLECGLLPANERITLTIEPAAIETLNDVLFKPNSVLVVSGGARGITAACLVALAKKVKLRLAILGRTELPSADNHTTYLSKDEIRQQIITESDQQPLSLNPRYLTEKIAKKIAQQEIHQTLHTLRETGSEVIYYHANVADEAAVNQSINDARKRFGTIQGIIHGAGIIIDKCIDQQTPDQFNQIFNTKIMGLLHLLRATNQDSIQFIGIFSSIVARLGNAGQVAYAMANETLNKVAQYESQKRHNCLVKSFNWGPWEIGMVTPELRKVFKQQNISLISEIKGTELFINELNKNHHQSQDVELLFGNATYEMRQNGPISSLTKNTINFNHPAIRFLLDNHIIKNFRVIPACLVLDWFFRIAKMHFPDCPTLICKDFKILRGVRFGLEERYFPQFFIQCKRKNLSPISHIINLSLNDQKNNLRYSAVFTTEDNEKISPENFINIIPDKHATSWHWTANDIYKTDDHEGMLFHGPALQVIQSLKTISPEGGTGGLIGINSLSWPDDDWQIDVAALDGVLQLIALGHYHEAQDKILPTSIGAITLYEPCPLDGKLTCLFQYQVKDKFKTLANAIIMQDNKPYAALKKIEMHRISI